MAISYAGFLPFMLAVEQQEPGIYSSIVRQSFLFTCTHRAQPGDDLMAVTIGHPGVRVSCDHCGEEIINHR